MPTITEKATTESLPQAADRLDSVIADLPNLLYRFDNCLGSIGGFEPTNDVSQAGDRQTDGCFLSQFDQSLSALYLSVNRLRYFIERLETFTGTNAPPTVASPIGASGGSVLGGVKTGR